MYPAIVILLVETQRSMTVICGISPSNTLNGVSPPALRPMTLEQPPFEFAVGPDEGAIDSVPHPSLSRALQSHDGQENWKAV